MFGIFKKKQSPAPPPIHPPSLPLPPGGEPFWNETGMARSIPDYIQLHLASRGPQHTLSRSADGPPLIFNDLQIRNGIIRLITEQLPNNPSVLSSLPADEIVSCLGGILVIRKWCAEHKLL
jgi:hypothetical protein